MAPSRLGSLKTYLYMKRAGGGGGESRKCGSHNYLNKGDASPISWLVRNLCGGAGPRSANSSEGRAACMISSLSFAACFFFLIGKASRAEKSRCEKGPSCKPLYARPFPCRRHGRRWESSDAVFDLGPRYLALTSPDFVCRFGPHPPRASAAQCLPQSSLHPSTVSGCGIQSVSDLDNSCTFSVCFLIALPCLI